MTKTIRIENADMSDWKVDIEVWDELESGKLSLVGRYSLDSPTNMQELYITSTRHIVIKEFGPGNKPRTR